MPRSDSEESIYSHVTVPEPLEDEEDDSAAVVIGKNMPSSVRSSVGASSLDSTPPTSLDGNSGELDVFAAKAAPTRRLVRVRSSLSSLHPDEDTVTPDSTKRRLARAKGDDAKKASPASRNISGATLVGQESRRESAQSNAAQEKLSKELGIDMHWDMADGQNEDSTDRRRSRRMTHGPTAEATLLTSEKTSSVTVIRKRTRELAKSVKNSVTSRASRSLHTEAQRPNKRIKVESKADSAASLTAPQKEEYKGEEEQSVNMKKDLPKAKPNPYSKKYQIMGLYAGQDRPAQTKNKKTITADASTTDAGKSTTILPLPMFGTYQRLTIDDGYEHFQLPYDILHPLPKEQVPKDWHRLNKNVFKGDARKTWDASEFNRMEASFCKCVDKCEDDCLNIVMKYECDDKNCRVGPECGNRPFAELKWRSRNKNEFRLQKDEKPESNLYGIGVETFKTGNRGFGVRTMRPFSAGQVIVEYCGEIIDQDEAHTRMEEIYKGKNDFYLMEFQNGLIIDAGTRGSICRFVNHSCGPNCEVKNLNVGGEPRMALFAKDRPIMTGEELTYDYNFENYSENSVQECKCGAANCRGILGPRRKETKSQKMMNAVKDTGKAVVKGVKRGFDAIRGKHDSDDDVSETPKRKRAKPDPKSFLGKASKTISNMMPAVTQSSEAGHRLQRESRDERAKRAAERRRKEPAEQRDEAAAMTSKVQTSKRRTSTLTTALSVSDLSPRRGPARVNASPLKNLSASPSHIFHDLKESVRGVARTKAQVSVNPTSRITSQTHLLGSDSASASESKLMRQSKLAFGNAGGLGFNVSPKEEAVDDEEPMAGMKGLKIPKRGSSLKTGNGAASVRANAAKSMIKGAKKFAVSAKLGVKGDQAVRKTIRAVSGAE